MKRVLLILSIVLLGVVFQFVYFNDDTLYLKVANRSITNFNNKVKLNSEIRFSSFYQYFPDAQLTDEFFIDSSPEQTPVKIQIWNDPTFYKTWIRREYFPHLSNHERLLVANEILGLKKLITSDQQVKKYLELEASAHPFLKRITIKDEGYHLLSFSVSIQDIQKLKTLKNILIQSQLFKTVEENTITFLDHYTYPTPTPIPITINDPRFIEQWSFTSRSAYKNSSARIHAAWQWVGTDCKKNNFKIAVIDSGIDFQHPDLMGNIRPDLSKNFIDEKTDASDDYYHGTHVAGIITAKGNNKIGIAGICHSSQIIAVKVADQKARITLSNSYKGMMYAVENGAKIMNLSYSTESFEYGLNYEALKNAESNGVIVVNSAGNDRSINDMILLDEGVVGKHPTLLGLYNLIVVGSHDKSGTLSEFSNFGKFNVHITAPGYQILSTTPITATETMKKSNIRPHYFPANGTSFSAPHVTGALALYLSNLYGPNSNKSKSYFKKVRRDLFLSADYVQNIKSSSDPDETDKTVKMSARLNVENLIKKGMGYPFVSTSKLSPVTLNWIKFKNLSRKFDPAETYLNSILPKSNLLYFNLFLIGDLIEISFEVENFSSSTQDARIAIRPCRLQSSCFLDIKNESMAKRYGNLDEYKINERSVLPFVLPNGTLKFKLPAYGTLHGKFYVRVNHNPKQAHQTSLRQAFLYDFIVNDRSYIYADFLSQRIYASAYRQSDVNAFKRQQSQGYYYSICAAYFRDPFKDGMWMRLAEIPILTHDKNLDSSLQPSWLENPNHCLKTIKELIYKKYTLSTLENLQANPIHVIIFKDHQDQIDGSMPLDYDDDLGIIHLD